MFWNNSRTFYNLSEALGTFGFLPLRGAGRLCCCTATSTHFWSSTIYTTFHREATPKNTLELPDYSVKIRSQVQTITRGILHRNQSPSVQFHKRAGLWTDFWQLDDIFEPPGWNELIVWKTDSRFFLSRLTRLARFARIRVLRHALPISLQILRKKPTVLQSIKILGLSAIITLYSAN